MKKVRVNCYSVNCNHCINAKIIKENPLGNKLFVCKYIEDKHKEMEGKTCKHFICTEYGRSNFCHNCNGGEPVKKLIKK